MRPKSLPWAALWTPLLLVVASPLSPSVNDQRFALGILDISEAQQYQSKHKFDEVTRLDCASQRTKALLRKSTGDLRVYVPVCSPSNNLLYERSQCYEISSYCWCVHELTGEPVPGSTTQTGKPTCDVTTTVAPKHKKNRCKGKRRTRFLRRMIANLKSEMVISGINSTKVSRDVAIEWKFKQLDINSNKIMERREWSPYKSVLLEWKNARHCSRGFFKSCDVDANRRLTADEWRKCIVQEVNRVPAKRPEQLNPFLYILKPAE